MIAGRPFPEFREATDAPRTNEFSLIQIDCFEILTHKKKEEENKKCGRPEPTATKSISETAQLIPELRTNSAEPGVPAFTSLRLGT